MRSVYNIDNVNKTENHHQMIVAKKLNVRQQKQQQQQKNSNNNQGARGVCLQLKLAHT